MLSCIVYVNIYKEEAYASELGILMGLYLIFNIFLILPHFEPQIEASKKNHPLSEKNNLSKLDIKVKKCCYPLSTATLHRKAGTGCKGRPAENCKKE